MESIFAVANWWNNVKGPLADAGINTLIGIVVVFVVLLFISYVISLFRYISVFEKKIDLIIGVRRGSVNHFFAF